MIGARFLAFTITSGRIFNFGVGSKLSEIDSALGSDYLDEVRGKAAARLLRRDYGLFEMIFSDERDWTCRSILVEVHRLSSTPTLINDSKLRYNLEFSRYTAWSDVRRELEQLDQDELIESSMRQPGYKTFRVASTGVTVQVVDGPEYLRDDFPGFGDVWSIEMLSPSAVPMP